MPLPEIQTRYAHTEGHSFLAYSEDGAKILTAGSDGEVRLYAGFGDKDETSHLVGDEVLAFACSSDKFYVAPSSTNLVQAYSLSDGAKEEVVFHFTADPTCVDAAADGSLLAAGSEDMTVKVRTDAGGEVTLEGHEAPVLSVSVDRNGQKKFVLSSSCDGTVRIWNVADEVEARSLHGLLPKSADVTTAETRAPLQWSPDAQVFAVAAQDRVVVFKRDSWDEECSLSPPDLGKAKLTALTWSADGSQVAAATSTGVVFVWNARTKELAKTLRTGRDYAVTALAWNPKKKGEISFIDDHGYWGTLRDVLDGGSGNRAGAAVNEGTQNTDAANDELNEDELAAALLEDDDDDENSFSIRAIKRDTGFLSDEENSNADAPEGTMEDRASNQGNSAAASPMPPPPPPAAPVVPQPYEPDLQEPFQPSATPVRLTSSYMVWNAVGLVRCINNGDGDAAIEVEFHDTAVHHPLHISNALGHTMADLSETNLALASEADEDALTPSRLVVHHFADQGREWSAEMPDGEEVMALCCSDRWVVAATGKRRLRIFTASGFQRSVLSLPGPAVAVAAHQGKAIVVVHGGMPLPRNQSLHFCLLDLEQGGKAVLQYQSLPLAPMSTLLWIGFSDEGVPCTADSSGVVRVLPSTASGSWVEVCDTRSHVKGKSDSHFVVGASMEERVVRTILCRGARYPMTVPRPTVGVVRMALPLCEPASEKSMLEEDLLKMEMAAAGGDANPTETLMKLFALACKSEQDGRAVDVCRLMDTDAIQLAMKYATRMRRGALANRLSELACQVQEREQEEERSRMARAESVDIFDSCSNTGQNEDMMEEEEDVNPILAAKMRKEANASKPVRRIMNADSEGRNPFKKAGGSNTSGAIRSGIVFDNMKSQPTSAKPTGSKDTFKEGFGGRKIKLKTTPQGGKPSGRQTTLLDGKASGKENKEEVAPSPQLKGFQLWLAENRASILETNKGLDEAEVNSAGLEHWKRLSKEEKEAFKTPRTPLVAGSANKRKRPEGEEEESNVSKSSRKKLAEFAAPE